MFSAELKERTKTVHAELEKKLVTRIKQITTTAQYVRLLKLLYGFYHPLQQKIVPFQDHHNPAMSRRGRQPAAILADIRHFETIPDEQLPLCTELPEIASYPSSLGALYVTEGSTLGGKIISSMISRQLGVSSPTGFSFFNAYGEDTPAMWAGFKTMLDEPMPDDEKDSVAVAATATFSTFKNWINLYESTAQ